MIVRPFRAHRPDPALAARIASPPYDVVDAGEARDLVAGNPYSFLRVVRAEVDLDTSVDPHAEAVYRRGRENLVTMIERGWLRRDPAPAFYVYRLETADHVQVGVAGLSSVQDYLEGRIRKHELTRADKEDDRVRHIDVVGAQTGPVLLTYRSRDDLDGWIEGAASGEPAIAVDAPDGVRHAVWRVDDPAELARAEALLRELPATYVADGHHRAASAARVAEIRRGRSGGGAHDAFLTVLFPSSRMRVLGYHRLVRDLAGLDAGSFLERLSEAGFDVAEDPDAFGPAVPGTFGLYLEGAWRRVVALDRPLAADPVEALDVTLLTRRVLEPILGVGDPRTDPRIEAVGGSRGRKEIERRVDSGEHRLGFTLHPTAVDAVLAVADAGRIMPPKSTWFDPKARSGLVVHVLDDVGR